MSTTIGERVRLARIAAGLTQKQVGEALGYKSGAQVIIAEWESGKKQIVREKIKPLAKLLNIDLADLLP